MVMVESKVTHIRHNWRSYFADHIVIQILKDLEMSMLGCIVAGHLATLGEREII